MDDAESSSASRTALRVQQLYQVFLDRITPHLAPRWLVCILLLLAFWSRILIAQGWYIIAYAHGIYLLSLFIAFLQPKFDDLADITDLDSMEALDGELPPLPSRNDEEFRPFIRRLPEFKFWLAATRATLIALICTLFDALDIPVFWPILLMYFLILVFVTMRRQIKHMIKYRYVPFTTGKRSYHDVAPQVDTHARKD